MRGLGWAGSVPEIWGFPTGILVSGLEILPYCRGVFEQVARYTKRYQESELHLAFILLRLFLTILI